MNTHTMARWCATLILGATSWACLDVGIGLPQEPSGLLPPNGKALRPSVAVALHLHGWSNHSGSSRPASIGWHTQQYAAAGVDVLWWSDHTDIYFNRVADFRVTPATPTQVGAQVWSLGTWGPAGRAFLRVTRAGTPTVSVVGGRVTVSLPPDAGAGTDTIELFFGWLVNGRPEKASYPVLARPLVGDPRFQFTVWRGRDGYLPAEIVVPLAWHPNGGEGFRQVLRYGFEDDADSTVTARGDTLVMTRAWPAADSAEVDVRPLPDASMLPNGADNTTDEYRIRFLVPRRESAESLTFSLPVVVNALGTTAVQMPPAVQLAHSVAQSYGLRTMWGIEAAPATAEISASRWDAVQGAGRHLIAYTPYDVTPGLVDSLPGSAAAFTDLMRTRGGVTSIAHPFGTSGGYPTGSTAENEALLQDLGAFLFQHRGWGAELLEVGYAALNGVGLTEHLRLLDHLTASGLTICGVGTTDSHGGRLLPDPQTGTQEQFNYVSWIGGIDRVASGAALIAGLRRCEVSFGNPYYVRGGFWITLEPDSTGQPSLSIDANGVSPSAQLYLYEAEIDSSGVFHAPNYRKLAVALNGGTRPRVGGCKPGFARLEAWYGTRALAFSNLVRIPGDPAVCAP